MNDKWNDRLRAAIQAELDKGRSRRSISLAAGLSPNYVGQFMARHINAGSDTAMKLIVALNLSRGHIFAGVEIDNEAEEMLDLFLSKPKHRRRVFLELLREE